MPSSPPPQNCNVCNAIIMTTNYIYSPVCESRLDPISVSVVVVQNKGVDDGKEYPRIYDEFFYAKTNGVLTGKCTAVQIVQHYSDTGSSKVVKKMFDYLLRIEDEVKIKYE